MKSATRIPAVLASCAWAALASFSVQAQPPPQMKGMDPVGLTVFTDINFRGRSTSFREDVPDMGRAGFGRSISSLRVASGERWEVCAEPNYRGQCATVWNEEANLHQNNWGDRIASARRVRGGGGGGGGGGPGGGYIVLFDQPNFRGNPQNIDATTPELSRFNDRARSVTIGRGTWELCEHRNFGGRCVTLQRSSPDLAVQGLSGRVSSVRQINGGGGGGGGPGGQYLVLYDQPMFRGNPVNFNRESASLGQFNDRARSVTVGRGAWQLCEHANFGGRCVTVTSSVPDLSVLGMQGRVSSLRPLTLGSPGGPTPR